MKLACIMALALFCATASAQASIPITGSISGVNEYDRMVSVNFGPTAQSLQLDLAINATSGTSGLGVALIDLEELAANGSTNAFAIGIDSGTAPINISLTTGTYSGVVDFVIGIQTDSGIGTSPFTGTLSCATLSAGAITAGAIEVLAPTINNNVSIFGRIMNGHRFTGATYVFEFDVDFGPSAHAITYFLQGYGDEAGSVALAELDTGGSPLTPATVTGGGAGWLEEINGTSTSRSGIVRFRLTLTPGGTSDFDWSVAFPASVTVLSLGGGGGGGGGDDKSCSTGESKSMGLLALLATLAVLPAARRLIRRGSP